MPPFAFETLLNQRIHQEEKIQKEMAACSRALMKEQQILDQLETDRQRVLHEIQQKQDGGITISEQALYLNFLEGMVPLIQDQHQKIRQREKQLEQKRMELIEAVKKYTDIELVDTESQAEVVHYPFFDLFFLTLPFSKPKPTVVTIHDVIPLLYPEQYPKGLRGAIKQTIQTILISLRLTTIRNYTALKLDSSSEGW